MRAGPLSNPQIIELLNAHFAPVYVSNEDYTEDGPAPAEERAERNRIWREANEAGITPELVATPLAEIPADSQCLAFQRARFERARAQGGRQ